MPKYLRPVNGLIFAASFCASPAVFAQTTVPSGLLNVISQSDNLCLGIKGGPSATQQTAAVEQETCSTQAETSQEFTFKPVSGGYEIVPADSGLALEPADGYNSTGRTIIEQWPFDD